MRAYACGREIATIFRRFLHKGQVPVIGAIGRRGNVWGKQDDIE